MDEQILAFIGKVITYGGAAAAVAYGLFVYLGKNWIEGKFAEKLASYQHAQSQELEQTKFKINSLFNRVTKFHEKEFEVLPEAWSKLHDTLSVLLRFVSVLQNYPDLNKMTEQQLDEFLSNCKLHDYEKDELKTTSDKLTYYQNAIFWHDLNEVRKRFGEFHTYIQKNRIFLSPDLKEEFRKIDDLMWESLIDREVGHEAGDRKMWTGAWKKMKEGLDPLKDKIEDLVQSRLHYEEK